MTMSAASPILARASSFGRTVVSAPAPLPPHALAKIRDVEQSAKEAHAVSRGIADQLTRLYTRHREEDDEIQRLTRPGTARNGYSEDHPLVVTARCALLRRR
jgi:hypothetical protein